LKGGKGLWRFILDFFEFGLEFSDAGLLFSGIVLDIDDGAAGTEEVVGFRVIVGFEDFGFEDLKGLKRVILHILLFHFLNIGPLGFKPGNMRGPLQLKIPQLLLQILNIRSQFILQRLILNLLNIIFEQFSKFFGLMLQLQHLAFESFVNLHLFLIDSFYLVDSRLDRYVLLDVGCLTAQRVPTLLHFVLVNLQLLVRVVQLLLYRVWLYLRQRYPVPRLLLHLHRAQHTLDLCHLTLQRVVLLLQLVNYLLSKIHYHLR
jgi:hypothetical protein